VGTSELRIVVFSHATRVSCVQGMHRGECCLWRSQRDVGLDLCTRSWGENREREDSPWEARTGVCVCEDDGNEVGVGEWVAGGADRGCDAGSLAVKLRLWPTPRRSFSPPLLHAAMTRNLRLLNILQIPNIVPVSEAEVRVI
jgi:hypothetical protein